MTLLEINKEQKLRIWNYLKTNSIAKRGRFDGNKENQLLGLIAEFEIHNLLLGHYPEFKSGFDNGVDIIYKGKSIDVKCMGRNVYVKMDYVNNFLECQLKYNCDVLIFASINKEENCLQICGWIYKKDIPKKSILYEKGERRYRTDGTYFTLQENTYEITNYNLIDFKYIYEINK
tara:strand:- start:25 stop:549 length:525 start_codon:yes stop_codon:yes gene_type:complete